MSTDVRIGILGAAGRMGRALVREVAATGGCILAGACERAGAAELGRDAGELAGLPASGVIIHDDPLPLFAGCDVVIDFTSPAAAVRNAELAAQGHTAWVVGTTGLGDEAFAAIRRASEHTAIVQSYNMSVGVNLLAALVRQCAAQLGPDWDVEIVEMHHRMKVDAPSGTAILLGEAAARGRGIDLAQHSDRGRDGITGQRQRGNIGFASLRGGNVAGDHTVMFAADNERIELTHKATDRLIFARGAVRAAHWAAAQKPGLYSMTDVLALSQ
jgi:4-hydroxy-tetrahydrodipicolinate reductase